ncbi:MAG: hypothetical protein R3356_02300 [Eudoraea sp.]|nr:hypothetical protein [Eudoraea sp.]
MDQQEILNDQQTQNQSAWEKKKPGRIELLKSRLRGSQKNEEFFCYVYKLDNFIDAEDEANNKGKYCHKVNMQVVDEPYLVAHVCRKQGWGKYRAIHHHLTEDGQEFTTTTLTYDIADPEGMAAVPANMVQRAEQVVTQGESQSEKFLLMMMEESNKRAERAERAAEAQQQNLQTLLLALINRDSGNQNDKYLELMLKQQNENMDRIMGMIERHRELEDELQEGEEQGHMDRIINLAIDNVDDMLKAYVSKDAILGRIQEGLPQGVNVQDMLQDEELVSGVYHGIAEAHGVEKAQAIAKKLGIQIG